MGTSGVLILVALGVLGCVILAVGVEGWVWEVSGWFVRVPARGGRFGCEGMCAVLCAWVE